MDLHRPKDLHTLLVLTAGGDLLLGALLWPLRVAVPDMDLVSVFYISLGLAVLLFLVSLGPFLFMNRRMRSIWLPAIPLFLGAMVLLLTDVSLAGELVLRHFTDAQVGTFLLCLASCLGFIGVVGGILVIGRRKRHRRHLDVPNEDQTSQADRRLHGPPKT